MRPDEARPRLAALGFGAEDVETLAAHFLDAEARGQRGHGLSRIEWLETWEAIDTQARPRRVVAEPGYERWDGNGALGYLTLDAVVRAQLARPAGARARSSSARARSRPGSLGYWVRRLAEGGLVALLTATSPRRLARPAAGEPLAGTNPLAIAIPSSDGAPVVADVSMGAVTYGAVLAGQAKPEELVPFGGPQAHKAFALAVGLQLVVDALNPEDGFGAVLLVARPEADPVPALRELAGAVRLPGDAALDEPPGAEARSLRLFSCRQFDGIAPPDPTGASLQKAVPGTDPGIPPVRSACLSVGGCARDVSEMLHTERCLAPVFPVAERSGGEAGLAADRGEVGVPARALGPHRVDLDRALQVQQRVEAAARPRFHAREVVEERRMLGLLFERLLVDADRLVPALLARRRDGREHRLPRRDA